MIWYVNTWFIDRLSKIDVEHKVKSINSLLKWVLFITVDFHKRKKMVT